MRRCRVLQWVVNMPSVEKPIYRNFYQHTKITGLTAAALEVLPAVACAAPETLSPDHLGGLHPLTLSSPRAGIIGQSERVSCIALPCSEWKKAPSALPAEISPDAIRFRPPLEMCVEDRARTAARLPGFSDLPPPASEENHV
jgi:hypothetical protein